MKRSCITTLDISLSSLTSLPLTNEPISNYTLNQASMATQHENTIWGGKIYTASTLTASFYLFDIEYLAITYVTVLSCGCQILCIQYIQSTELCLCKVLISDSRKYIYVNSQFFIQLSYRKTFIWNRLILMAILYF